MLATTIAQEWLSGRWLGAAAASPTTPQNSLTDIYGCAIAVGTTVKFVGKVTAVNASSSHFKDITVVPVFPSDPSAVANAATATTYQFHPLQLVVV